MSTTAVSWGLYAQSRYHLTSNASLLAGLRWNTTHETRDETRVNSRGVVTATPATQDVDRFSGSLGAAVEGLAGLEVVRSTR